VILRGNYVHIWDDSSFMPVRYIAALHYTHYVVTLKIHWELQYNNGRSTSRHVSKTALVPEFQTVQDLAASRDVGDGEGDNRNSLSHTRNQTASPACQHSSFFYRPDTLHVARPTASEHWRHSGDQNALALLSEYGRIEVRVDWISRTNELESGTGWWRHSSWYLAL